MLPGVCAAVWTGACGTFEPPAPLSDRDRCDDLDTWDSLEAECNVLAAAGRGLVTGHYAMDGTTYVVDRETVSIAVTYGDFGNVEGSVVEARTPYYVVRVGIKAFDLTVRNLSTDNVLASFSVDNGVETDGTTRNVDEIRHRVDLSAAYLRWRAIRRGKPESSVAVCACGAINEM